MDDFDYSVHIADRDWDAFLTESDECILSQASLADLEDPCLSDIDDPGTTTAGIRRETEVHTFSMDCAAPDFSLFGPLDFSGSPIESDQLCCTEGAWLKMAEDVLSGSEEEMDLESVNTFLEQFPKVAGQQNPTTESLSFQIQDGENIMESSQSFSTNDPHSKTVGEQHFRHEVNPQSDEFPKLLFINTDKVGTQIGRNWPLNVVRYHSSCNCKARSDRDKAPEVNLVGSISCPMNLASANSMPESTIRLFKENGEEQFSIEEDVFHNSPVHVDPAESEPMPFSGDAENSDENVAFQGSSGPSGLSLQEVFEDGNKKSLPKIGQLMSKENNYIRMTQSSPQIYSRNAENGRDAEHTKKPNGSSVLDLSTEVTEIHQLDQTLESIAPSPMTKTEDDDSPYITFTASVSSDSFQAPLRNNKIDGLFLSSKHIGSQSPTSGLIDLTCHRLSSSDDYNVGAEEANILLEHMPSSQQFPKKTYSQESVRQESEKLYDFQDSSPCHTLVDEWVPSTYGVSTDAPKIHAISAFWEEMEKLTINDILHIRLMNCNRDKEESFLVRDKAVDLSETTQSQLAHQTEDSNVSEEEKCSSGLGVKENLSLDSESNNSQFNFRLRDLAKADKTTNISKFTGLRKSSSLMDFKRILLVPTVESLSLSNTPINKSVSAEHLLVSPKIESIHNITVQIEPKVFSVKDTDQLTTEGFVNIPVVQNNSGEDVPFIRNSFLGEGANTSYMASVPEMFEYFFCDSESDPSHVIPKDGKTDALSVAEMYDYFFSDFGNEVLVANQGQWKSFTPILPHSTSSHQVCDHFFSDIDEEEDSEEDCGPIRVISRMDAFAPQVAGNLAVPETYDFFCSGTEIQGDLFSRFSTSFRKRQITAGIQKFLRNMRSLLRTNSASEKHSSGRKQSEEHMGKKVKRNRSAVRLHFLENDLLRFIEEQTRKTAETQMAVAVPRKENFLLTFDQTDMCLVCIAFASWAMRSANLQSPDMWKTALLANVSAISAIRYFRRYVKEDKVKVCELL
ncbi:uncharacterized protein LOC114656654 [Erpetoichthys calabaricus]|uniref:uncharacterized protein LOC114656654 n=1 Tax=Erpetoichthys calabaricus TaxID=27687 RepID=UPI002234DA85|nr:uncharacterized protein LOC114656654 [Erpetoichthys calabaricus]